MKKIEKIDEILIKPKNLNYLGIISIKEFDNILNLEIFFPCILQYGENFLSIYKWIEDKCGEIIDWDFGIDFLGNGIEIQSEEKIIFIINKKDKYSIDDLQMIKI